MLIGTIRANDTYELKSLGILLRHLLTDALDLTWRAVDDEYGRDPCLVLGGTSVVLFPMTMLSKRIERGEHVDVRDLANGITKSVEDVRSDCGAAKLSSRRTCMPPSSRAPDHHDGVRTSKRRVERAMSRHGA